MYYEKSLNLRSRIKSADDPQVIEATNKLASTYQKQGKYPKAEQYFNQVLRAKAKRHGPGAYEFAETHSSLGDLYLQQKDYDKAIEKYKQVVALNERYKGPASEETMHARRSLAKAYLESGDKEKSKQVLENPVVASKPASDGQVSNTKTVEDGVASLSASNTSTKKSFPADDNASILFEE